MYLIEKNNLILKKLSEQHLLRVRRVLQSAPNAVIHCDGKSVVAFCSNDYLGLANHPKIIAAFKAGIDRYGVSSCASPMITGYSAAHQQLEVAFADWLGYPRALLFSSGTLANYGVMSSLLNKNDLIFQDKLNHASLIDGTKLSQAKLIRYAHQDLNHLQQLLQKYCSQNATNAVIASDGVFSMDGDIAALPMLIKCAKQFQLPLIIDDAHGMGILAENGKGILAHYHCKPCDVDIVVCPLGKAFSSYGAIVCGNDSLIEMMMQKSRTYIYNTALPPAQACASYASLQLIQTENWRREKLKNLIRFFQKKAAELSLPIHYSETPIQILLLNDNQRALQVAEALWQRGFLVMAIRPPSVPKNKARLRITLMVYHSEVQIQALLTALAEIYDKSV